MRVEMLTPYDQLTLDPYHKCRDSVNRFKALREEFYDRPSRFMRLKPDEMFGRYQEMLENFRRHTAGRHEAYFEYNQEMYSKYGPQGGMYSWDRMLEILQKSYDLADRPISITQALKLGIEYLRRLISQLVDRVGYPQFQPSKMYNTFAGTPTGGRKGSFISETEAMKPGWRHLMPDILGQRRMRLKDRLIHQDSVVNVRYVEPILAACRNWLKTYVPEYFNGWIRPDMCLTPMLTNILDHTPGFVSIETDYNSMDLHFQLETVEAVVLPIYEVLLPEGDFLHLVHYVSEAFEQPVFAGDSLITGKHTLFSGQPITNDFETIFSVVLAVGSVLQWNPQSLPHVLITANGDDIAVVLRKSSKVSMKCYEDLMQIMIASASDAGLAMSLEKCRLDTQSVRFCRKVYYPRGRRDGNNNLLGAYPSVLALNNIVQPETPQRTPGFAAIADLQRMDNVAGSPEFTQFVHFVRRFRIGSFEFTSDDVNEHPIDWWERVYGERWDPTSSLSYNLMCNKK